MTALQIFIWTIQIILVPIMSPVFIGLTKKIKAHFQNRRGASIFQPYRDLWKLFHKDEVISRDASWISYYAPYLIFAITIIIGGAIPLISTATGSNLLGDFLTIVYLFAFGTFFLALCGLDSGGGFGGLGASREMMVAALTEGGLIVSLVALVIISHTTNLSRIAAAVASLPPTSYPPVMMAFLGFFIAFLAETARYPFDNPATHLELTMIHEAMILEFSGKRLALLEWAAANKYLIFMILGANLFFPWGLTYGLGWAALVGALAFTLLKITIFCLAVAIIESTMAKLRIFRLPDLLFTSFIISVIAIGLLA